MDSNQPTQQVPIVNGELAQLLLEVCAPMKVTHQNLNDGNASTTIYTILLSTLSMSFDIPGSSSMPSVSESSMLTKFLTPTSPSPKLADLGEGDKQKEKVQQ